MRKNSLWLSAIALSMLLITSCQKEGVLTEKQEIAFTQKNKLNSLSGLSGQSTNEPIPCGTALQVNLVDYYPTQYYQTYGTIKVANDANNVYVTLNSLTQYGFNFSAIKLTVGDLAHLQDFVPYYDYNQGPPNADYTQNFATPIGSYTFTIPKSSIAGDCFNVFVWAYEVKSDGTDSRYVWVQSDIKTTSNANSSYINYCLQTCTPPPTADCGQLRTQTPGGWGAPPHGNNPGTYLHSNFATAFPAGLVIGSSATKYAKFTTAQAITNFLPSGGPSKTLTKSYTNPTTSQLKNTLAGHLVALTLSVQFDLTDPSFGTAGVHLGDMIIGQGKFKGWTVKAFLDVANKVFSGDNSSYKIEDILSTASDINENYVDGKCDKGYLICPNDKDTGKKCENKSHYKKDWYGKDYHDDNRYGKDCNRNKNNKYHNNKGQYDNHHNNFDDHHNNKGFYNKYFK